MQPLLVSGQRSGDCSSHQRLPSSAEVLQAVCLFELLQRAARVRSNAQATTRAAQVSCTGCTALALLRLLLASVFRPLAQYLKIGVRA